MSIALVYLILFLAGALVISFLCSILESSLMSTPVTYLSMLEESGVKSAKLFKSYKENIDKPIAAILALNTIANTIGAAGVGKQATEAFGSEWFGLVSAITTILVLIFAEILPKTIGALYWKKLIGFTSKTIKFLIFIMYPLVIMIQFIGKIFDRDGKNSAISRDEVTAMANIGEQAGVIKENENKVIQNIIKLDKIKVMEVMTPRTVTTIADEEMDLKTFYQNDKYLHYSRIPLYSDTAEYISGYILLSDALEGLADDKFDLKLKEIRRPITYFKEEQSIRDAWETLLASKEHIGLVIDEYGSFQGVLTLEDIIESILGLEIIDESDEATDMQQFAKERWERRMKRFKTINIPNDNKV